MWGQQPECESKTKAREVKWGPDHSISMFNWKNKLMDKYITKPNVNKHVTDNKEDACTKCYSNIEESVANCLEKVTKEVIFEHSFEG